MAHKYNRQNSSELDDEVEEISLVGEFRPIKSDASIPSLSPTAIPTVVSIHEKRERGDSEALKIQRAATSPRLTLVNPNELDEGPPSPNPGGKFGSDTLGTNSGSPIGTGKGGVGRSSFISSFFSQSVKGKLSTIPSLFTNSTPSMASPSRSAKISPPAESDDHDNEAVIDAALGVSSDGAGSPNARQDNSNSSATPTTRGSFLFGGDKWYSPSPSMKGGVIGNASGKDGFMNMNNIYKRYLFSLSSPELDDYSNYVNRLLQFKTSELRQEYTRYSNDKKSFFLIFAINFFVSVMALISVYAWYLNSKRKRGVDSTGNSSPSYNEETYQQYEIMSHVSTVIGLITPFAGWYLFYQQIKDSTSAMSKRRKAETEKKEKEKKEKIDNKDDNHSISINGNSGSSNGTPFKPSTLTATTKIEEEKSSSMDMSPLDEESKGELGKGPRRKLFTTGGMLRNKPNCNTNKHHVSSIYRKLWRVICRPCVNLLCFPISFVSKYTCVPMDAFLKRHLHIVQYVFLVSCIVSFSLRAVQKTLTGQCVNGTVHATLMDTWLCNPYADRGGIPFETVAVLIVAPIIFAQSMREIRLEILSVCWLISSLALAYSSYLIGNSRMYIIAIVSITFTFFSSIDVSHQNIIMFLAHRRLCEALKANEDMAEEAYVYEMRHMIANVAHDLKTVSYSLYLVECHIFLLLFLFIQPLSSFMTGIDIITQVSSDILTAANSSMVVPQQQEVTMNGEILVDHLSTISYCVNNIRNTNAFMLMTINRCIDYTKASKGMKLVPKYETVDLHETLHLPLNCMRNIQQKVSIVLHPLDQAICSHIITDKQWLQENVLCLLSNAVKYSSSGEVSITVSLYSRVEIEGEVFGGGSTGYSRAADDSTMEESMGAGNGAVNNVNINSVGMSGAVGNESSPEADPIMTRNESHRHMSVKEQGKQSSIARTLVAQSSGIRVHPMDEDDAVHSKILSTKAVPNKSNGVDSMSIGMSGTTTAPSSVARGSSSSKVTSSSVTVAQAANQGRGIRNQLARSNLSFLAGGNGGGGGTASRKKISLSEYLFFEIEDHGIGVTKEKMETLFNPFKQAQRLAGGTGLGLYSLAKRIEALNGKYGVRKRRDGKQGSLFWFSIPYRPDDLVAEQAYKALLVGGNAGSRFGSGANLSLAPPMTVPMMTTSMKVGMNTQIHKPQPVAIQPSKMQSKSSLSEDGTMSVEEFNPDSVITGTEDAVGILPPPSTLASPTTARSSCKTIIKTNSTTNTNNINNNNSKSMRILIVEDSHTIAKMTSMMLKRHGHQVTIAEHGEIALQVIKERWKELKAQTDTTSTAYDVILMDLQMPVMDGLEATRRLRELEKSRGRTHQLVVGVSANSDHETTFEAFESGIDDFIAKPFDIETFYKTVSRLAVVQAQPN